MNLPISLTTGSPGYTLPVFAVAAAMAAWQHLQGGDPPEFVLVNLGSEGMAQIPIEQVARLDPQAALAICRSDPGPNLDLTRHTPIWAWVQQTGLGSLGLVLEGGEGIGHTEEGDPAIYRYARGLFAENLKLPQGSGLRVRVILPQGRQLAQRTSNAAFGVLEGLALLGTHGVVEPHSAVESLDNNRQALRQIAQQYEPGYCPALTFCIGSHGHQVATDLGIPSHQQITVGNWIGALLVEAALYGIPSVRLVGYHGKLIKAAGGILNTSSHLADGRLEILAAAVLRVGGSAEMARQVLTSATVEAASQMLRGDPWGELVWGEVQGQIRTRAQAYVHKYADRQMTIEVTLFDRQGRLLGQF